MILKVDTFTFIGKRYSKFWLILSKFSFYHYISFLHRIRCKISKKHFLILFFFCSLSLKASKLWMNTWRSVLPRTGQITKIKMLYSSLIKIAIICADDYTLVFSRWASRTKVSEKTSSLKLIERMPWVC